MIEIICFILLCVLILPDIYIFREYIRKNTSKGWLKTLYFLPTILLGAWLLIVIFLRKTDFYEPFIKPFGTLAIIFLLVSLPKLAFSIASLIGRGVSRILKKPVQKYFNTAGIVLGAAMIIAVLYGRFHGINRFTVKEVTFESANLPKGFDGYRIVQLSDIHLESWKGREGKLIRMVNTVNRLHPDLIVITGDLVTDIAEETDNFTDILPHLMARNGVFSILGNHDYGMYIDWESPEEETANLEKLKKIQEEFGWTLLTNENEIIINKGDSIALIGVENEGNPPFPQNSDLKKAGTGTDGLFKILLTHDPSHWKKEVLPETDIDLTLSGHTHAMQVNIFGLSPAIIRNREWGGMYTEGNRGLYVNVGLGYTGLPLRLGAWPEITVITLKTQMIQKIYAQ